MIDTAVILAGGKGTRLSEKTKETPKPMLQVGGIPILTHIINQYEKYGVTKFLILAGYLGEQIIDYYYTFENVDVIGTGVETQTGGRLLRASPYLPQRFYLTYGDGISTVNPVSVENIHVLYPLLVTLTAVRPVPRFGTLKISNSGMVREFSEKQEHMSSWINGGFMVVEKAILKYIRGDETNLEKDVLPQLAKNEQLAAYKYSGYWHCIDTLRDLEKAEADWNSKLW